MKDCKFINECRLCNSDNLILVLNLCATPPANQLVKNKENQVKYPLDLLECQNCGCVQLSCTINPNILFSDYLYVSGTSPSFVNHFKEYCQEVINKFKLDKNDHIIDIGSNDGTLLAKFKNKGFENTLGFEPAEEIAKQANLSGIKTIKYFFNQQSIKDIKRNSVKLILANNVFAHADNLTEIIECVKKLLTKDGVFVFEVSHLYQLIKNRYFDMVYSEHIFYHHLGSLLDFLVNNGLDVIDVKEINTHGGSLRVYAGFLGQCSVNDDKIKEILDKESEIGLKCSKLIKEKYQLEEIKSPFEQFEKEIKYAKKKFNDNIKTIKWTNKRVAGYGCPAKLTTLLYYFDVNAQDIDFIVEDSEWKQGYFTAGKHIPIFKVSELYNKPSDYCVIFAWNFAKQIIKNHRKYIDAGNCFIIPLPKYLEINKDNVDEFLGE